MADTDSDMEIQFNVRNETNEEGQGDVPDQHNDGSHADVRSEASGPVQHHDTPVPMPEARMQRDDRRRSRSYESFDELEPQRSPNYPRNRVRNPSIPGVDHLRYHSPHPFVSHSPRAYRSPQRYEEPMVRPAAINPHRLHVKPEIYDGTDDWDQYISHFQNCADLGRWSETDKALTLSACLKGQARAFYLGLSPLDRTSYYRLVQKFSERFGSVRQQSRYLTKFETRKRKLGETIASLGDDLRLLAQRAYPDLGLDAQESLALHQFYKAISLEMKCRCIDRDCRTVESAVQVVERYEAILGEGSEKKRSNIRAVNNTPDLSSSSARPQSNRSYNKPRANDRSHSQSNTDQMLQQVLDRLDKLEGAPTTRPRYSSYKPNYRRGACFVCQSPDHYLKDCPIFKKCQFEMQATGEGVVSENANPSAF